MLDQILMSWAYFSSVSMIFIPKQLVQNFGVLLNIRFHVYLCPKFVSTYNYNTIYLELIVIFIFCILKNVFTTMFFVKRNKKNDKNKCFFSLTKNSLSIVIGFATNYFTLYRVIIII